MEAESKNSCFPEVVKVHIGNFWIDIAQIQKDNSSEFLEDGKSEFLIQDKNHVSAQKGKSEDGSLGPSSSFLKPRMVVPPPAKNLSLVGKSSFKSLPSPIRTEAA